MRSHGSSRSRPSRARPPSHAPPVAKSQTGSHGGRAWVALAAASLAVLFWACRGASLGVAVADDYAFLGWLRFRPFDVFDSMGAAYYWRPVTRQLYFSLVGPWLIHGAWAAVTLHAALLLALFGVAFAVARRAFPPPVAAAIAAFPLASEPARVLLGWPSGAQHLVALLALAIAVHETLARRIVPAALAAAVAVLSHDAAAPILAALPLVAGLATRSRRETIRFGLAALAVAALWGAGYALALRDGVELPPGVRAGYPWLEVPRLLARGVAAQLNLEDQKGMTLALLHSAYVVLFAAVGILLLGHPAARQRLKAARMPLALAAGWFVIASLPLALVWPDWNAWRGSVPALGLGVALTLVAGAAHPWLAPALLGVRLAALAFAPAAQTLITIRPPVTTSDMSFVRLARLQRIVDRTRVAVTTRFPTLRRGADVRYWAIPRMADVGFQRERAVRVWYGDSTITWRPFGGMSGTADPGDVLIEFEPGHEPLAVVIEPLALAPFRDSFEGFKSGRPAEAESLLVLAAAAQSAEALQFHGAILRNRARVRFNLRDFAGADSLNELSFEKSGPAAGYYSLVAHIALARRDRRRAAEAVRECLALEPNDPDGRALAEALGVGSAGGAPP
jgi:hypothetical protein